MWSESKSGTTEFLLTKSNLHVANYCGVSVWTVTNIRKEGTEAGSSSFITPGKKRPGGEEYKFNWDKFDQRVIQDLI